MPDTFDSSSFHPTIPLLEPLPDSGDSRTAILDAAELLFARQGYAATTIKQIGENAVRNSALIHYYFGSKENLYREVLRRVLGYFVETASIALATAPDPEHSIRQIVGAQAVVFRRHPHLHYLIVREMVDWGAAHAEDAIHSLVATLFRRFCDFIAAGQRDGRFRADLDPRYVTISIISQLNWVYVARPAIGVFLGRGLGGMTEDDIDAFAEHIAEFALAGLRPVAAVSPGAGAPIASRTASNKLRRAGPAPRAPRREE